MTVSFKALKSGPQSTNFMSDPRKPQAASHMLWFFVLPSMGFVVWASYRLLNGVFAEKHKDVFARIANIESARTPADRWQAAYELSQDLQKIRREPPQAVPTLSPTQRDSLFISLGTLLKTHASDARLKRYLLITIGQMGDARGLASLEDACTDPDSEVRFFASWGLVDLLSKKSELVSPERLQKISAWLNDSEASIRKIAASFLVQQHDASLISRIEEQLKDSDKEVRWNAAAALASVGNAAGVPELIGLFNLENLRSLNLKSSKDLTLLLSAAFGASKKLSNPSLDAAIEKLRGQVQPSTPEGRAILAALAL